jgi:hypothetical protein
VRSVRSSGIEKFWVCGEVDIRGASFAHEAEVVDTLRDASSPPDVTCD